MFINFMESTTEEAASSYATNDLSNISQTLNQWDVLHWEYIRQFEDQVYYGLTEKYPLPSPKDTQSKETTL